MSDKPDNGPGCIGVLMILAFVTLMILLFIHTQFSVERRLERIEKETGIKSPNAEFTKDPFRSKEEKK